MILSDLIKELERGTKVYRHYEQGLEMAIALSTVESALEGGKKELASMAEAKVKAEAEIEAARAEAEKAKEEGKSAKSRALDLAKETLDKAERDMAMLKADAKKELDLLHAACDKATIELDAKLEKVRGAQAELMAIEAKIAEHKKALASFLGG